MVPTEQVHPIWLRVVHWLNALGILVMVLSGWRIYDASPFFPFNFPTGWTLGGWLGGALQWHFAAMWIVFVCGAVYLLGGILTGRLRRKLFPVSPRAVRADLVAAFHGKLSHEDLSKYNAVQKLAYIVVILAVLLIILSGLVLWKSVQFSFLRELLGGYESARRIHFIAMATIVAFVGIHVVMAILNPRTILAMIRGR